MTGAPSRSDAETMPAASEQASAPPDTEAMTPLQHLTQMVGELVGEVRGLRRDVETLYGVTERAGAAAQRAADHSLRLTQELHERDRIERLNRADVLERLGRAESRLQAISRAAAAAE